MKILKIIVLVLLILLSISSGAVKIALIPDEVEFFGNFGFSNTILIIFGVIQLLAGLALIIKKPRKFAAIIIATTFVFSSALIFIDGNILFAVLSIVPVLLLAWIIYDPY